MQWQLLAEKKTVAVFLSCAGIAWRNKTVMLITRIRVTFMRTISLHAAATP